MSEIKHSPGPWMLRTTPTSAGLCHIVSAADWRIAFIYGDLIRKGVDDALPKAQELTANARLIAAAPDLLEALHQYGIGFTDESAARAEFGDYEVDRELKRREAISKATGEQP